ncbi:putative Mg2+ transporter-C (MgtC) family protein [Paucimonas lemoignei]|uniref:Protein MgtC n=1 Tax=Paucimonas lemoignei TaxID=29443 RepID=A0A4R3HXT1_PAULE|nr:putative Mg2+ transporter-C (MgtC) family protein [Paucimonas lemoignei]
MLSAQEITIRLLVAAILGGMVGLERERLEWVAGLRTHMLVALGSALVMLVSAYGFTDILNSEHVMLDPSRVAAQVVSGIGFLGAGTILFLRQEVIRGLTTAASLWSVAAVGLAVGGGLYLAAVFTTVLILIILALVKPIERRLFGRNQRRHFLIEVDRHLMPLARIETEIEAMGLAIEQMILRSGESIDSIDLIFVRAAPKDTMTALAAKLQAIEGVQSITLKVAASGVR